MPPIKPFAMIQDTKKKKKSHVNPSELKNILKQTFSNAPTGKKGWVPPMGVTKKIMDHKKHYISPYSQKAILQQKGAG